MQRHLSPKLDLNGKPPLLVQLSFTLKIKSSKHRLTVMAALDVLENNNKKKTA